jgi:hypothetical protein
MMERFNTRAPEGRHKVSPGRKPWEGFKISLEPRSRGPRHARFSRGGVGEGRHRVNV